MFVSSVSAAVVCQAAIVTRSLQIRVLMAKEAGPCPVTHLKLGYSKKKKNFRAFGGRGFAK